MLPNDILVQNYREVMFEKAERERLLQAVLKETSIERKHYIIFRNWFYKLFNLQKTFVQLEDGENLKTQELQINN
jgi:hypothetical protein